MTLSLTYVGLDDEAFGEGQDDTQPIDTWLMNRLAINLQNLALEPRSICFSPVISSASNVQSFGGIRPYANIETHTFCTVWVLLHKGQTGVLVDIAYHVDTVDALDAGTVEVKATLGDGTSVKAQLVRTAAGGGPTPEVGVAQLSMVFDSPSPGTIYTPLYIETRSIIDVVLVPSVIGAGLDGTTALMTHIPPNRLHEDAPSVPGPQYWVPNPLAALPVTAPVADSREMMFYRVNTIPSNYPTDGINNPKFDLNAVEGDGLNGSWALSVQQAAQYNPAIGAFATGVTYKLPMFQLRAIHIEPLLLSSVGAFTIVKADLVPNVEFGSAEGMRIVSGVRQLLKRPRQLLVGPKGVKHNGAPEYFNRGYAMHWPFVTGNLSSDKDTTLINDSFFITTEDPDLELVMWWIHVQHGATNINLVDDQSFEFELGSGAKEKGLETSAAEGFSHWDLTISVDQMDFLAASTASWAANSTNYGLEQPIERFRMDPTSVFSGDTQSPLQMGLDHQQQGSKGGGGLKAGFWFNEGSLFPRLGDMRFLQQKQYSIPLSGTDGTATQRPFRLKVNATWDSAAGQTDFLDPSFSTPEGTLRLVLAGFALFEIPRNV